MTFKLAVLGATGAVGREILNILHERKFPISKLKIEHPLAPLFRDFQQ